MGERVIIVGMNNPLTTHPRYALWPEPVGCTGWRLWKLLESRTGATQTDYVRTFQRVNLVRGRWRASLAREGWESMRDQLADEFDVVLLLGAAVRQAAGMGSLPELCTRGGVATLPHPSGLNRWYNDPVHRAAAEILMEELYVRSVS